MSRRGKENLIQKLDAAYQKRGNGERMTTHETVPKLNFFFGLKVSFATTVARESCPLVFVTKSWSRSTIT
jgi:hypothetical protein